MTLLTLTVFKSSCQSDDANDEINGNVFAKQYHHIGAEMHIFYTTLSIFLNWIRKYLI